MSSAKEVAMRIPRISSFGIERFCSEMGETLAFEQRRRDCTPVAVGVVTYAFAPMPTMLASEKMARFESSVNLTCRGKDTCAKRGRSLSQSFVFLMNSGPIICR